MGIKLNADEILIYLVGVIKRNLDELASPPLFADRRFIHGEKTAYVECLEIIQEGWERADEIGLEKDIERSYPI